MHASRADRGTRRKRRTSLADQTSRGRTARARPLAPVFEADRAVGVGIALLTAAFARAPNGETVADRGVTSAVGNCLARWGFVAVAGIRYHRAIVKAIAALATGSVTALGSLPSARPNA
jgi:hypothetical protein